MIKKLTQRQIDVLQFIIECMQRDGYPPTISEIGEHFGITSTNGVHDHLAALQRKGYIQRDSKARCIRLTEKAEHEFPTPAAEEPQGLPLVGRIAAGHPILADESVERILSVSPELIRPDAYCLRVEGESMVDAGILDGDILIVDPGIPPSEGDIVVALVDDEATVKHYHPRNGYVELRPANAAMSPLVADIDRVYLQGVVVGLQRIMRR